MTEDELLGDYKPLTRFAKEPTPSISCIDSIRECCQVLGTPEIEHSLEEVGLVTESKLSSPNVSAVLQVRVPAMLHAAHILRVYD